MYMKWMETCIKTRVLTSVVVQVVVKKVSCCCAGSGEEGVMEDVKRDKCVYEMEGNMHKNKSTYWLLLCR